MLRSIFSVKLIASTFARSYRNNRHRSVSQPGCVCARYAIHFPSGEYAGPQSFAGFVVIRFGGAPPAASTVNKSPFVLSAASGSVFAVKHNSLLDRPD